MKKIKRIISCAFIFIFSLSLFSCDMDDDDEEIMDIHGKFNDTEYVTVDGYAGSILIEDMIDDDYTNHTLREYSNLSFFPKKDIAQDYFSAFGFTLFADNYYGEAIVKFTIEDEVIKYEEREIIEIIDGEEVTRIELVEVSREIEPIELTGANGQKVRFNGSLGVDYGVDLDYEIKTYSASTCFKMEIFMSDGTTPINFKWAMDGVEILIIPHEDMVE